MQKITVLRYSTQFTTPNSKSILSGVTFYTVMYNVQRLIASLNAYYLVYSIITTCIFNYALFPATLAKLIALQHN